MNQRERNELRRHIKLNQCGISKVYGCFVSSSREIISWLDSSYTAFALFFISHKCCMEVRRR